MEDCSLGKIGCWTCIAFLPLPFITPPLILLPPFPFLLLLPRPFPASSITRSFPSLPFPSSLPPFLHPSSLSFPSIFPHSSLLSITTSLISLFPHCFHHSLLPYFPFLSSCPLFSPFASYIILHNDLHTGYPWP